MIAMNTMALSTNYTNWYIPIIGLYIYILMIVAGHFAAMPALNLFGAGVLIYIMVIGNYSRMLWRFRDSTILLAISIVIVTIIGTLLNSQTVQPAYFVKHIAILLLYAVTYFSNYSPISQPPEKKHLFYIILILIAVSLFTGENIELDREAKRPGLFANPNNLSLISLSFLFLIDDNRDSKIGIVSTHLLVTTILLFSATMGAILAYLGGLLFKHRYVIFRSKYFYFVLPFFLLLIFLTPYLNFGRFYFFNKLVNQFYVINNYFLNVVTMQKIDYGVLVTQYGSSALSGIWRLEFWSTILYEVAHADYLQFLFGHGIGSALDMYGNLPHNEYLRILSEQGLIGLVMTLAFYLTIYFRLLTNYRYLILIFALFSFTENNLDNFLYMSLLMLFLASSQEEQRVVQGNCNA